MFHIHFKLPIQFLNSQTDSHNAQVAHVELSPCGRWAYVGNRVGVGVDGACANCVEGSISVLRVDGAEVELVVSKLDNRERQRETGRDRGRQRRET